MDLKTILKNIGLNEKEAAVYLACLELGESKAAQIATRAQMNRVTSYDILNKLLHKGYVSQVIKNKLKTYTATEPKKIWEDIQRKQEHFKAALPKLMHLHQRSSKVSIQYFEGLEGIKSIYADSLNSKTEIINYADSHSIREFWPEYDEEYVKERVKKRIFLRGLTINDEWGQKVKTSDKGNYRDLRLIDHGPFEFANEIKIYDNKVAIISFGKDKRFGILIESPEVANAQRAIFLIAWNYAGMTQS